MKKIFISILCLLTFVSCDEEIDIYNGESGMYFSTKDVLSDSIFISWGLKPTDVISQQIDLVVNLYGNTAPYDRPFQIRVVEFTSDSLQGFVNQDFLPVETSHVIPKNSNNVKIPVTILRNPKLKERKRAFKIELIENDELQVLYSRRTMLEDSTIYELERQRVIVMDEKFPKPWWWSNIGQGIFGTWSVTKSALICDVMKIDREVWVGDLVGNFTSGYLTFVGQYMHRWLQEQDPQVMDENGEPMTMGDKSIN
ncbi:MAG: DUF4843 domain-containing protein [Marinifilaceae bacterium]